MEIDVLNELIALSEEGRFSEAAEKLYTTSSSLSKHMHSLENEIGVELFDRSKRAAVINKYGATMLPYAKKIVALKQEMITAIEEKRRLEQGTLSINTNYRVFEEVIDFHKEYGINILLTEEKKSVAALKSGSCELAFTVDEYGEESELFNIPYKTDRIVVLCNKDHPLANRESVDLLELKDENFVTFPDNKNPLSHKLEQIFQEVGYEPYVTMTATVGSTIARLVSQNMGISLLWEKALKPIMSDSLVIVPLKQLYEINVNLSYLKDAKLSENAKVFIEFINARKETNL